MKQILKNTDKSDLIGVYRFKENDFIVGNIIKVSDDYLFLNSCDIYGKYNGIKIVNLDIIDRLIVKSDYIDSLNELRKNKDKENRKIELCKIKFIEDFYKKIIDNKVLLSIELEDESTETGYMRKKTENKFYFDFVNDDMKVISTEIIKESYIKRIKLLEEIEDTVKTDRENTIRKIVMNTGEIYFGNVVQTIGEYFIFREKREFNENSQLSIIKIDKIEEINELINFNIMKRTEIKNLFKNIDFFEILKISMENKLVVSIDNEDYEETKVGIIIEMKEDILKLKRFEKYKQFSEISIISYSEIQSLYVHNYEVIEK
ncbi:hypothetical protein [Pseudoleptotrichia goodfellowii]|uniref:Uncharacterized protein n=1 Tax=Pseudoleptotrichia goodfellowii TaxID=157692 RepID=A0A510JBJ1_9FUSO|nr:hypothetical protein [Pseudoleptotrichia goodfellowii]BBM35545.1 hypothetical protein JCM16774_0470 [Pseudoleptotrichia goodfellowii]